MSLPYVFDHHARAGLTRTVVSVPHGGAARNPADGNPVARPDGSVVKVVLASPLVNDAGFVREFTHPRITLQDCHRTGRPAGAAAG